LANYIDYDAIARGLDAHLQLRMAISDAGGKLESPSIEFGDDSDSLLVENLLASVSQCMSSNECCPKLENWLEIH
jgi:hypothetical protein